MVPQQDGGAAELCARCGNASVHAVVGQRKVAFKAASVSGPRGRSEVVKNQGQSTPPSVRRTLGECADGDVEKQTRLQWTHLHRLKLLTIAAGPSSNAPIHGDVAALSIEWMCFLPGGFRNPAPAENTAPEEIVTE